jgi:hypothetical protein
MSSQAIILGYLLIGLVAVTAFLLKHRNEGGLKTIGVLSDIAVGEGALFVLCLFLWPLFFIGVWIGHVRKGKQ